MPAEKARVLRQFASHRKRKSADIHRQSKLRGVSQNTSQGSDTLRVIPGLIEPVDVVVTLGDGTLVGAEVDALDFCGVYEDRSLKKVVSDVDGGAEVVGEPVDGDDDTAYVPVTGTLTVASIMTTRTRRADRGKGRGWTGKLEARRPEI